MGRKLESFLCNHQLVKKGAEDVLEGDTLLFGKVGFGVTGC